MSNTSAILRRYVIGAGRTIRDAWLMVGATIVLILVLESAYSENARIVEALAPSYGFQPIYVWQPALLSTRKRLTPREAWLQRPEALRDVHMVRDVHMAVPTLVGPALAPIAGGRFIDATDLFRDDPLEVFVDLFGHTYERANPRIVDTLMPNLAAAVSRAASRPE